MIVSMPLGYRRDFRSYSSNTPCILCALCVDVSFKLVVNRTLNRYDLTNVYTILYKSI